MSTPTIRRCFTFGCTGSPEGTAWECPRCKRLIHLAGEQATRRAEQAKKLAASVPHTRLGSELAEVTS